VLLGESFGVDYPEAFSHPLIEYRALTTRAGLIDLTHWGVLRLTGADRTSLLNNMITGEISSLPAGHGRHGALTTVKGKLVAELFVLVRPSELLVLVAQGDTAAVADTLDKHIVADDVILEDASEGIGVLSVEGPKCREVVWRLFPDAPIPLEPLRFTDTDYQGTPVTILRNGVTGERGMQVIVPAEGITRIRDYLVQSGVAEDMELCGRAAWSMRRMEAGLPWWGTDVDGNFPKECRLDHVVDYNKGCYLGQETLARMHFRGHPNWLLVGLRSAQIPVPDLFSAPDEELPTVEADRETVRRHIEALELTGVVDRSAELYAGSDASAGEGKAAGRITSLTYSPKLGSALFLGYVRAELAETAAEFVFSTGDEVTKAAITQLPVEEQQ
jgi:folate-binding protein YgfZ